MKAQVPGNTRMNAFRIYIDEAGDEGFTFRPDRTGSSEWFVLSAVITRVEDDLEAVKLIDRVRLELNRDASKPLHFRNLKHEHRLPLVAAIGRAKLRTVSVLIHKPSVEADHFGNGHLYRYATRLLLERVSWLCRDARKDPSHCGQLIFSNRASMCYGDLCAYLAHIRTKNDDSVRIDWTSVDCEKVRTEQHHQWRGLQVVDAVASSMFFAARLDRNGFNEPRYAELLRPTVYAHQGRRFGYGVKVMPAEIVRHAPPLPGTEWLRQEGW